MASPRWAAACGQDLQPTDGLLADLSSRSGRGHNGTQKRELICPDLHPLLPPLLPPLCCTGRANMSSGLYSGGEPQPDSCPAPSPPAPLPPTPPSSSGSSSESLMHAVAGGVGSALALALTYPLDQLRTFQQVDDSQSPRDEEGSSWGPGGRLVRRAQALVERHGRGVLWRGILPMLIAMGVSNFVYFGVHSRLKDAVARVRCNNSSRAHRHALQHLGDLGVAALAGVVNVLVTTPLWVASTRAKLSSHRQPEAIWAAIRRIYREEGIAALWSGTLPSLLLVSNPAIQFFLYDLFKRTALRVRRRQALLLLQPPPLAVSSQSLGSLEAFVFGAVAKAMATLVSYPLQVAQCRLRMQEEKVGEDGKRVEAAYSGTLDCLAKLWEAKGLAGWFQGLESKLLQTITTSAFMFLAYERIFAATRLLVQAAQQQEGGGGGGGGAGLQPPMIKKLD